MTAAVPPASALAAGDLTLGLTFDDVLLLPARSEVMPEEADLRTRLTRELNLNIPLVSAAMDTVTEARAAICLACQGGIGIIHRNTTPEAQAAEVIRVKKYESGVIADPVTISKQAKVREVVEIMREHEISGVPVLDGQRPVGIVTNRDLRFARDLNAPVQAVMTPEEDLVTVRQGTDFAEIERLLHKHRIEKVLVVDDRDNLAGLVTVKDIQKSTEHPNACRDAQSRLMVGAAVGIGPDSETRVEQLIGAGVDVLVVDTAHGHSVHVIERVRQIKQKHPEVQVVGGNVATAAGALELVEAGADAVKVGVGPGSICTTRMVAGIGVPQLHAITEVARALADKDVPLIADGGIRYSGDIAKSIAAGAHSVMLGGIFAGSDEAPGEIEIYQGRSYKCYRGMGSLDVMASGSRDRYFQHNTENKEQLVPEGVEGRMPYKGPMRHIIHQMAGGVRASMGYTGNPTIEAMRTNCKFIRVTDAGMRESHVHDVSFVKEVANYHHR